jgi:hypothetical protein
VHRDAQAFFAGLLRMHGHGFAIITFAQSAWMIWAGALLLARRSADATAG